MSPRHPKLALVPMALLAALAACGTKRIAVQLHELCKAGGKQYVDSISPITYPLRG